MYSRVAELSNKRYTTYTTYTTIHKLYPIDWTARIFKTLNIGHKKINKTLSYRHKSF